MNNYNVGDYGDFETGLASIKNLNDNLDTSKNNIADLKAKLNSDTIFMGPICENCLEIFTNVDKRIDLLTDNFSKLGNYLIDTATAYKDGDEKAKNMIVSLDSNGKINITQKGLANSGTPISSVEIPNNINQSGYTVTCYGEDGWHLGGSSKGTPIADGTGQKAVHEKWVADGARYKNGIAVLNVDGVDHYLIAVAPTYGKNGDNLTVHLKNGEEIPCIIADTKSTRDSNYTKYGHAKSGGTINVLEFEVDTNKYNSSGNPTTKKWNLEWDSSSGVAKIDNYGTII